MKKILAFIVWFFCILGYSQVGINTTDPKAQLEIQSSNQASPSNTDGLLIPKVDTFPATNPGANQNGMLVFLTTTVGANSPGFYYWDNTTSAWIPIGNNSNLGWNLNGNIITATNFIGSTNNQDVLFKRNNLQAGRIGSINTAFGTESFISNTTGNFNSAFGSGSLKNNTTGSNNTAIGRRAMELTTTGRDNAALGFLSMRNNTTGNNNSAFGSNALLNNTAGNSNSAFGNLALSDNLSGSANNAFGSLALRANTTGNSNNAFGTAAMLSNTEGLFNSAFGQSTLSSNTLGDNNSAFGYMALRDNTLANQNSAFGRSSLILNTTGTSNSGFGYNTLETNRIGSKNTAVGSEADVAVNNLSNATAIGANAQVGASNSMVLGSINGVNGATTDVNVGIGTTTPQDKLHVVGNIRMEDGNEAAGKILISDANGTASWEDISAASGWGLNGNSGTNSSTNFMGTIDDQDVIFKRNNRLAGRIGSADSQLRTSFGDNAASSLTSGTSISAFGVNALEENTTGGQNNAFGSAALRFNTSGTGNSAFGNSALIANISGNANAAFGTQALQSNRASMNAAVGYQALENNTTGSGNTALGHMALTGNVDGSFNTAIGKGTGVLSTSNPSNATAIGAFARVDTSNSLVLGSIIGVNGATSSVNVGIGTTSPTRRLHVSNGASGGTSNANTGILLESDVNVYQHFLTPNNRESGLLFGSNTASIHGGIIFDNSDEDISFRTGGNTTRMTLINSGYLGIGTATPAGQLELSLDEGRKPASSTWTITSDARLKNVTGDYHKGLTEIIALKPIRYNYKNTDKRTFEQDVLNKEAYGFLAQEVQTVFPEAVGVDDDGYLNFNLHPILIASINAFKELNTKYEEVKSENEALKDKLNALLVRVEALENQ